MTDFEGCLYRTSEEVQERGVMTTEKAFDGAFSMAGLVFFPIVRPDSVNCGECCGPDGS
jgi:hypothetical protein